MKTPRKPKLFNVAKIDGRYRIIYQWDSHFGYRTQPLEGFRVEVLETMARMVVCWRGDWEVPGL